MESSAVASQGISRKLELTVQQAGTQAPRYRMWVSQVTSPPRAVLVILQTEVGMITWFTAPE